MYPWVEFMERETFLIKVIRPRGEDSQSRNRYAHIAFIRTQSHSDTHTQLREPLRVNTLHPAPH